MKILIRIFIMLIMTLLYINSSFSQDTDLLSATDSIDEMIDEEFQWLQEESNIDIVVGVSKYEQRLIDVPATVSVLDMSDLSTQIKTNIPELLRTIPGVTVYRNHGDSPWYRVSLRGLNDNFLSARTLVTIDGVPFFQPHGGGVDLSWLPIANIERIEVIKGTFSTLYGANAFGGVVNIVTKKGNTSNRSQADDKEEQKKNSSAGIQVFGRENIDNSSEGFGMLAMAAHSGNVGSVAYHLSADVLTDEGYRENWQVTPTFMGPQSRIGLFDSELEQKRGRFSWNVNSERLLFAGFYTKDEKDILGLNDDLDDRILNSSLTFSDTLSKRYNYLLRLYYNRFEEIQEATDSYKIPSFPLLTQPFFYDLFSYTIGGEFQNDFRYSDSLRLVFGADIRYDVSELGVSYRDSDGEIKPFGYPRERVWDYGAYFQAEYYKEKFRVLPGVRYDYDSESGSFISGKIGIVYLLNDAHSVYGVAGRGFRSPNFNERFVNLFGKQGTADLEPEKTWQFEIGSKNKFFQDQMRWDISAFHTIADDYIDTDAKRNYFNTSGVTVWGAETDWSWQVVSNILMFANFSLIIGEYDENGEDIELVPKHKWSAGLSYNDHQNWLANLTVRGESHKTLENPLKGYNGEGSYQVTDISLSRRFMFNKSRFTATLFADNLFDKHYVESGPGAISLEGGQSEGITLGLRIFLDF